MVKSREGFPDGLRKLPAAVSLKGGSLVAVYSYWKMIATEFSLPYIQLK